MEKRKLLLKKTGVILDYHQIQMTTGLASFFETTLLQLEIPMSRNSDNASLLNLIWVKKCLFRESLLNTFLIIGIPIIGVLKLVDFFATDGNSQNTHRLVHTSLIDFNNQMKPTCRLCKTFEETISSRGHKILFHLKIFMVFNKTFFSIS